MATQAPTTTVVNVQSDSLRQIGFRNLQQWLDASPKHVYIGRSNRFGAPESAFANPFKVDKFGRDGCIREFEKYLRSKPELLEQVPSLEGCVLGCWCKPQACHGDVLVKVIAEMKGPHKQTTAASAPTISQAPPLWKDSDFPAL
eukprot:TRINITY_DN15673_c0_g1_i1.p1 TRINITY_DN15673_c0_g1~~TRINITY_DN15673_c0_g1_i1.p1  ORF type:complete len:151 (+),score=11.58 TRINITY_DN15673_c0_g1_i1:23-454(+)